jgi:hypothetical protein
MDDFIGTALAKVYPQIDFTLVERVAAHLLNRGVLEEQQLATLIPHRFKLASRYRLQRMNGLGRLRSAVRATRGFES